MQYKFENRKIPLSISKMYNLSSTPHIHPHIELIYLTKGRSVTYVDGKRFLLEPGNFFLSFPNQIHFYHVHCPVEGYLIIFAPEYFKDLKDIFRSQIPISPIIKLDSLLSDVEKILETIFYKNKSDLPLHKTIAKGYLLALLSELLSGTTLVDAPADSDNIKNLLIYCTEHYTEPLSLNRISQELHLSKYYISHIFSDKLHVSFPDFINSLRVERACAYLEKEVNITEVAFSSGFSSIRTFNRAFIKQMNMTPRDYMKQKKSPHMRS